MNRSYNSLSVCGLVAKCQSMQNLGSFELLVGFPCVNLLSNRVGSPYLSLRPQGGQRSCPRGFAWSYISSQQECTEIESRRSSVSSRFRNRNLCVDSTEDRRSNVSSSFRNRNFCADSAEDRRVRKIRGAGSSVGGSGYGTRAKGRPTCVPQWTRPDGGDGPPPPPPPTSLPSWAIISGSEKVDVPQDRQQMSGIPTSGPSKNTGETVPPHASGALTSDQHRNTVGTVAPHTSGASTSDRYVCLLTFV